VLLNHTFEGVDKMPKDKKVLKIGFYLFWIIILFFAWDLENGKDFPSHAYCHVATDTYLWFKGHAFIDGVYQKGFFVALVIQVVFGVLKWLIFDRHSKGELLLKEKQDTTDSFE
jgi:hypothetical protein